MFCVDFNRGYWKGMDPMSFGMADCYGRFIDVGSPKFVEGKVMLASGLGALAFRFPDQGDKIREFVLKVGLANDSKEIYEVVVKIADFMKEL